MKSISLGTSKLAGSRLAYGCWRIADRSDPKQAERDTKAQGRAAVIAAYEAGYTLFDHADIYGDGVPETIFGEVLKEVSGMREKILIATKCGIRKPGDPNPDSPYRYDFSGDYIMQSCDASLKRLGVETIDIYQLHRPDFLMDPHEVAGAFCVLKDAGKVREFGVSNFKPSQVAALQKACPLPLIINQVEISLANLNCFSDGTLDQCLTEHITPMAWSPLAAGLLADGAKSLLPAQKNYRPQKIVEALDEVAKSHEVSRQVVALAWLLKHPSKIVPIIGSTIPARIREATTALDLKMTREEWYRLFVAARGEPLP